MKIFFKAIPHKERLATLYGIALNYMRKSPVRYKKYALGFCICSSFFQCSG